MDANRACWAYCGEFHGQRSMEAWQKERWRVLGCTPAAIATKDWRGWAPSGDEEGHCRAAFSARELRAHLANWPARKAKKK